MSDIGQIALLVTAIALLFGPYLLGLVAVRMQMKHNERMAQIEANRDPRHDA